MPFATCSTRSTTTKRVPVREGSQSKRRLRRHLRFDAGTDSSCTVRWDAAGHRLRCQATSRRRRTTTNRIGGLGSTTDTRSCAWERVSLGRPRREWRGPLCMGLRTEFYDLGGRNGRDDGRRGGRLASARRRRPICALMAVTDSSCTVRWDAAAGATDYDVNYKPAVGGKWTNEPHRGTGLSNTSTT